MSEEKDTSITGIYLTKPKKDTYFFVDFNNSVEEMPYEDDELDNKMLELNNAFISEEYAKQETLRKKIQEFIRRCAIQWNENHDWRKKQNIRQFCLVAENDKILYRGVVEYTAGEVYFDTEHLANICINNLYKIYTIEELKIGFGLI